MKRLRPAVDKSVLLLLSGLMWSGVGVLLDSLAYRWLLDYSLFPDIAIIIVGLGAALLIAFFGFGKIAVKNINRILGYKQRVCLFAFQEWKSYILIGVMMSMGIFIRSSGFLPRYILAPMYIAIGTALFISSFKYYQKFFEVAL